MKYQKFLFIGLVFFLFLSVSCTKSPIVSQIYKETEDKFMYIANLYVEEEEKAVEAMKFMIKNDIAIKNPTECSKYFHDTNHAIGREFYNRTYPKHLESFRNLIVALGNHTTWAFSILQFACVVSRSSLIVKETFILTGNRSYMNESLKYLQEAYDYERKAGDDLDKADEALLRIKEFLNT